MKFKQRHNMLINSLSQSKVIFPYMVMTMILIGCNSGSSVSAVSESSTTITCSATDIESVQQCTISSANAAPSYGLNNMPYALCSQTLCTVENESSVVANCICPIINKSGWQSASLSPSKYVSAQPTWNLDNTLQSIQSDYSLANYPPVPQQCNFTTLHKWASCFGVRCSALADGQSANCKCPINSSYSFLFELPTSLCETNVNHIWSAAPINGSGYDDMLLIYANLYPNAPVLQSHN